MNLIQIAQETIGISNTMADYNYYVNSKGETVDIKISTRTIFAVDKYSPETLAEISLEGIEKSSAPCRYAVIGEDTFTAAKSLENPLVMNFANAHTPGGGFLHGARAQEEALCRMSTLYKSISNDKAKAMYRYNRDNPSPVDSDYMLLSPNVIVFRNKDLSLLDEPYKVAVGTIAAPDRGWSARNVPEDEINHVMKERLRKYLLMAIKNNYRNLVLGAWGCGAFRNDPDDVSRFFHELLIDEKMGEYFENIVFAILGGGDNFTSFEEAFADVI